jgi:hypothetical protein
MLKNGMTKHITLRDDLALVITTESPAPCSITGVRDSIQRKQFDNREQAIKSVKRSVKIAWGKGWKDKRQQMPEPECIKLERTHHERQSECFNVRFIQHPCLCGFSL